MSNCNFDCESCKSDCHTKQKPGSMKLELKKESKVRRIIGVVSGKGGVGKSSITSLLATYAQRKGNNCAILDADITGPSIGQMFNIHTRAMGTEHAILPAITETGIQIMSINMMLETENTPVLWRGPILADVVKQFYSDVLWDKVDLMFIDMPPGTGDVPLTVFQSIPLDGIIIVTTPQDLVSMVVSKAIAMAKMMNVEIYGLIENMSYLECEECNHKIHLFGESSINDFAKKEQLEVLAQLPLRPEFAQLCDAGNVESATVPEMMAVIEKITR